MHSHRRVLHCRRAATNHGASCIQGSTTAAPKRRTHKCLVGRGHGSGSRCSVRTLPKHHRPVFRSRVETALQHRSLRRPVRRTAYAVVAAASDEIARAAPRSAHAVIPRNPNTDTSPANRHSGAHIHSRTASPPASVHRRTCRRRLGNYSPDLPRPRCESGSPRRVPTHC